MSEGGGGYQIESWELGLNQHLTVEPVFGGLSLMMRILSKNWWMLKGL